MAIFSKKPKHSSQHSSSMAAPPPGSSPPAIASRMGSTAQPGNGSRLTQDNFRPTLENSTVNKSYPSSVGNMSGSGRPTPSQPRQGPNATTGQNALYPWSIVKLQAPTSSTPTEGMVPPPFPRYGHSINPVSSTGDLYIFGGLVRDLVKNDLYCISTAHTTTNPSASLPVQLVETYGVRPGARVGHASVGVGNVLIVWGGDTKIRKEDKQDEGLYLLNIGTRDWTRVAIQGASPVGRYGHSAAMVGSRFFIFGGQRDDGVFLNDLSWFDLQKLKAGTPRWNFVEYQEGTVLPPRRTGHTTVTHGDCIYVFGGTDGSYHYNDTWCFDTNTQTWQELSCIGYIPVPREGHAATLVDDVMYVFGGRGVDGKDLEDLAAFRISTRRWYMFQNMGPNPSGRSGHAMAAWQGKVFVLGGESYTSKKLDDPSLVHVLDTTKIKYPSDWNKAKDGSPQTQAMGRKTSSTQMSQINGPAPPSVQIVPPSMTPTPPPTGDGANRSGSNNSIEDDRSQATSPPNVGRRQQQAAKKQSTALNGVPVRPRREGDDDPSMQSRKTFVVGDPSRASSPTSGRSMSPTNGKVRTTSPVQGQAVYQSMAPPSEEDHRLAPSGNVAAESIPQTITKSANITGVKANNYAADQAWMLAALALASSKGFLLPASPDPSDTNSVKTISIGNEDSDQRLLFGLLMQLKQELARAKTSISDHAVLCDAKLTEERQLRLAAVKETAYYRSKLAALEGGPLADGGNKLDRERVIELERKLIETTTAYDEVLQRVGLRDSELKHEREMRKHAEETATSAIERAQAAETSYTRSLTDYAELQRRARANESTVQDQFEKIATFSSSNAQVTAENVYLKDQLQEAQTSLDQYLRTLEQTRSTLTAANAQADEMENLWERAKSELSAETLKTKQLQIELDTGRAEIDDANSKVAEMENVLKGLREECTAMRKLTSESLAELVATSRLSKLKDEGVKVENERIKAVQEEANTARSMHKEIRQLYETSAQELEETKAKHALAEKQLAALKTEVSSLRQALLISKDDSIHLKKQVFDLERDSRDKLRISDALELKLGVLKSIMTENGLTVAEEDMHRPSHGDHHPEHLIRKVEELERELQLAKESAERENIRKDTEIDHLSEEVDRLRSRPGSRSADGMDGEEGTSTSLQSLQERYRQLEISQSKAVQYIKSSEKSQRKLKDEVKLYKDKVEDLETKLAAKKEDSGSFELKKELESVTSQLQELSQISTQVSIENKALEAKMTSLRVDYEAQIATLEQSKNAQSAQYKDQVDGLQKELSKFRRETKEVENLKQENESLRQEVDDLKGKISLLLEAYDSEARSSADNPRASSEYSLDIRGPSTVK